MTIGHHHTCGCANCADGRGARLRALDKERLARARAEERAGRERAVLELPCPIAIPTPEHEEIP